MALSDLFDRPGSPLADRYTRTRWAWVVLALLVLYFAYVPVDVGAQIALGAVSVVALIIMRRLPQLQVLHILFLSLAGFLTLRYLAWRLTFTIVFHDLPSFSAAVLLFFAELYGIGLYLISLFVNVRPLRRKSVPIEGDPSTWPTVDVMVPSYNEAQDILEVTLMAAAQMRYPEGRMNVYLCDDGGTVQKRTQEDPVKAAEAETRHRELKAMCDELGVGYRTREKNLHAKAGNVNSALETSDGDLVLILDADHVPTEDFLLRTVGWFQRDPKLFLMQTPHFFLNPDPIEKNLGTFGYMPSENEMFYRVIQKGLDFWGASFFCGSAALLRRTYLMEIGGISGESITEDAETALELHSRGYHSAYIDRPLIAGLQPESLDGFVVQRTRWAQGMVQIFLLKNPLRAKGLTIPQRMGYFNSSFFWFFGYSRFVFLLAPACFLLFGLQIYRANLAQFIGYAIPHLIGSTLVANYLFKRVRWLFISELYETMQSLFTLLGIIAVFLSPRSPAFGVTPKGEQLDHDFISPIAKRFYAVVLLNLVCLGAAYYRYQLFENERGIIVITAFWALFNLFILLAALGSLAERKQRRATPRVPVDFPCRLWMGGEWMPARMRDLSIGGAGVKVPLAALGALDEADSGVIRVRADRMEEMELNVGLRGRRYLPDGIALGLEWQPADLAERRRVVRLMFSDSRRWLEFLLRRERPVGLAAGAWHLFVVGVRHTARHGRLLVLDLLRLPFYAVRALRKRMAES